MGQYAMTIDIRGKAGDIRFECPRCHWGVTLTPEGAAGWTLDGMVKPRCAKDGLELKRTVLDEKRTV